MTIEGQRYLEECRKVLNAEQMEVVSMAVGYGLQISEIRKVVQSNKEAQVMKAIVTAMMEGIEDVEFLCERDYNQFQIREIAEGLKHGLALEEVQSYAGSEIPANRMRTLRMQLEEKNRKGQSAETEPEMQSYMKNLMEIMEQSILQFKESNERFNALSSLVKEHVVEEKNREIKDLYENLRYKDKNIQDLRSRLEEKEKQIAKLEQQVKEKQDSEKKVSAEVPVPKKEPLMTELIPDRTGTQTKTKKRMTRWLLRGQKIPQNIVEKIIEMELSVEQLEEVRQCVESNLSDVEILQVVENKLSPERMRKMREIILLMKKRKAGV